MIIYLSCVRLGEEFILGLFFWELKKIRCLSYQTKLFHQILHPFLLACTKQSNFCFLPIPTAVFLPFLGHCQILIRFCTCNSSESSHQNCLNPLILRNYHKLLCSFFKQGLEYHSNKLFPNLP